MDVIKREPQYSRVAKEAYQNILGKKTDFKEAWCAAASNLIASGESRKKVCPKSTFIGLCESGDLKGMKASAQNESINYEYAKFAIAEWKKDPTITKIEMWQRVVKHFNKGFNHQGQLDVALGLKDYWK